jgi:hypothetical protein
MSLILRGDKGQKLTSQELDNNFLYVLENATGGSEFNGGTVSGFTQFLGGLSSSGTFSHLFNGINLQSDPNFSQAFSKFYIQPFGWVDVTIEGDFLGFKREEGGVVSFSGDIDGNGLVGQLATISTSGHFTAIKKGEDSIGVFTQYQDRTSIGQGEVIIGGFFGSFKDGSTQSTYQIEMSSDQGDIGCQISKVNNDGEFVGLRISNNQTGFEIQTSIQDESSLFKVNDDSYNPTFDVTQLQVIMEKVVNYDYADDSTAQSAGVPIGGIYHTGGTLKIRLNLK